MDTRAVINLKEGVIELQGTEQFVTRYLDIFRAFLDLKQGVRHPAVREAQGDVKKTQSGTKRSTARKSSTGSKTEPEEFDTHGNESTGILSLKAFMGKIEKAKLNEVSGFAVAVGYYLTMILHKEAFSEGNIEFAYRFLKIVPGTTNLHKSLLDLKNKRSLLKASGDDNKSWELTAIGKEHFNNVLEQAAE